MANQIDERLKQLNIQLPSQAAPAANYVPFLRVGELLMFSGQIPTWEGEMRYCGKLGQDFSVEEGQEAARLCGLNILAHLHHACDVDLSRVKRCVRLGGFVNCTSEFIDQSLVINGASDLMVHVFGEQGRHIRTAVGVDSLPFGVAVEIDAIFEVEKL